MTILACGGAGYIGAHVVLDLLGAQQASPIAGRRLAVTAAARPSERARPPELAPAGAE